ncbi:MAG: response regulator [Clostridia bacterium]|nr:response regulator [Clostridia bacterium]
MKTIVVDDEAWALNQLAREFQSEDGIELVGSFLDPREALAYAERNTVEFALLDVKMGSMNGIELGAALRRLYPGVIIVYVSSYPEYFSDAYRSVRADYYMLKPYRKEDVKDVMERVSLLSKRHKKQVQFRTFGRFDLFINEQPVKFSNQKAKELLAVCVDRKGGIVRMEEAIDKLWEGSPLSENIKARYRKAVAYLNALFLEYRLPNVFVTGYGSCHIIKENVSCDYYEFLESKDKPIFFGQYMNEYSWAEETAAMLEMQMQQNKYR